MLPTFRILPPGTASVPPAPTAHAGLAAVLAAVMAAAMALAAVAAVSVDGHASADGHGARTLPPLAQGPVSSALGRADRAYRVVGLRAHSRPQRLSARFAPAGTTIGSGPARARPSAGTGPLTLALALSGDLRARRAGPGLVLAGRA